MKTAVLTRCPWLCAATLGLILIAGCGGDVKEAGPSVPDDAWAWDGGDVGWDGRDAGPSEDGPWGPGSFIVGRSLQNRPIVVEQYGVDGPVLLLLSAIHGDERTAVTFGEQIRSALQAGMAELAGIRIAFVGAANPDGIALETRYNAGDIDLNRNFPTENFSQGNGSGGPYPLSEPETQALKAAIDHCTPAAVISVHCCIPLMDYDGPAYGLASAMSEAMTESARFPVGRLGSLPGSMGSYVGLELQLPIVTLEFALAEDLDTLVQLDNVALAIEAAAQWVFENGEEVAISSLASLQPDDADLEFFVLAESAGGFPIRVETMEQGSGPPVLLVSGLIDNDPRALFIAEHIRRVLLSDVTDVPLLFLTAANPDGILTASTLNSSGWDVAEDFRVQGGRTEEAAAFISLVDALQPRLVIDVQADDLADSAASAGFDREVLLQALPAQLDDRGTATGPLADFLTERSISVLLLGVHRRYGRGDDLSTDYFPDRDPVVFSTFVRRLIKPGVLCAQDGFCDRLCSVDPDCECGCNFNQYCEAATRGSEETCACDPDCQGGQTACSADGHCDTWCPSDVDPDCPCSCDFNQYCEAAARGSAETCRCDPDCQGGQTACSTDGHCDTWCPSGVDPDC